MPFWPSLEISEGEKWELGPCVCSESPSSYPPSFTPVAPLPGINKVFPNILHTRRLVVGLHMVARRRRRLSEE
ncbi:hypothetical protein Droror1_Dr00006179, partial [Drosera rotundifolia]